MSEKMIKRFVILALALSLLCPLFTSCEKPKERFTTYTFDYFDTVTSIIGYADSKEDFDEVANRVLADLAEYHNATGFEALWGYLHLQKNTDRINQLFSIIVANDE